MTPQGILTRSYALGHTTRRQQGLFLRRSIWLTAVGVVFLFCYVQGATAAIALVQKVTNANASPGASSIAATLPAAVAGGNLMVVAVDGWPNDGTSVPSSFTITESRSNSYSIAGVIQAGNSNMYSALYMRGVVAAQSAKNPATTPLAQTPPMGWNSWNKFACNVSESLIRETADALVSSGMWAAGYQYVNIDDCWQESRDAQGNIDADPARFPSGIKALPGH